MTPTSTFEDCAVFYDALTAHHNYEAWMADLEELARRYGLRGTRLLDIACGTGKSFMPMLRRGYAVTGCDVSPQMLDQAAAKTGGLADLFVADMCRLGPIGEFDLVTCIDEPLNYLTDEEQLAGAFRSAAVNLAPCGIYLFDLNTVHTYRTVFGSDSCWEADGWLFVWRGTAEPGLDVGSAACSVIEAFQQTSDGRWLRRSNTHVQRHFPEPTVRGLLRAAGLRCLAVHGQFRDGRIEDAADDLRHTKFIYVCAHEEEGGR